MPKAHLVGLHVSAAGGVENAPERALELGAECFQFFSRSPRGGGAAALKDEQIKAFRSYKLECYIHTPYYINFASKNRKIYHGSINVVREELERGSQLGVKYAMTHLGSAKDWNGEVDNQVLKYAIAGLKKIYAKNPAKLTTKLLLEISAGAGAVLGDSFEELAALIKGIGRKDVHICLDTCHLFASGYDVRDKKTWDETLKAFKKHMPLSQIKLIHVNDSKGDFGDHKDRHEHIGKGKIGEPGFKAMLAHSHLKKVNFILETKHDKLITNDLNFLKKFRK